MEEIENKKLLNITKGSLVLFIYSILSFFYFHYKSHDSSGHYLSFDFKLSDYIFYLVICFAVLFWILRGQDINKKILKSSATLLIFGIIAGLIRFGILSYLFPIAIIVLILLVIIGIIHNLVNLIANNDILLKFMASISCILLLVFIYANYNDLSIKQKIIYKNNSMFDSIEECSQYIYSVRQKDCQKDFTDTHNRWFLQQNINLVPRQDIDLSSGNYEYFPKENLTDVKIGEGDMAKYGDIAIVNILSANINGKIYSDLKLWHTISESDPYRNAEVKLNEAPGLFEMYATGVIGMRVGGVRYIKFKIPQSFWFEGIENSFVVKPEDLIIYTVELVSLKKNE